MAVNIHKNLSFITVTLKNGAKVHIIGHMTKFSLVISADFLLKYKGNPKLGDTPSLLYMMKGDPTQPEQQSWGGKFVKCSRTPRKVIQCSMFNGQWSMVNETRHGPDLRGPTLALAAKYLLLINLLLQAVASTQCLKTSFLGLAHIIYLPYLCSRI